MPQTGLMAARAWVVHWPDLAQHCPTGTDYASKSRRRELFDDFDPQGNGILFQAHTVRGLFRLLPPISGISDIKIVLRKGIAVVVERIEPVTPLGIDRVDRNQFRCLLIYIWHYVKLWDLCVQLFGTGQQRVTRAIFEKVLPDLREWGFEGAEVWAAQPALIFERMDREGTGLVRFEHFAEFCLRHALPDLCKPDGELERHWATELLRRTHPHLFEQQSPKKQDIFFLGSVPPVPPPGQRRPPVQLETGNPFGSPTGAAANQRWRTQYMQDYLTKSHYKGKFLEASSAPCSPVRSHSSSPSVSNRLANLKKPSNLETGVALIRSASLPEATMRTKNLGRTELRAKLENHLDMYSTGQMRKMLKVAGGMTVNPNNVTFSNA